MSRLAALMELLRLPALFTAMADVFAGYLFHHESLSPLDVFLPLLGASSLIYLAGMVLNDVCDVEQDRRERPQRPIPSGRISRRGAAMWGLVLLASGVALSAAVSRTSVIIACVLVVIVVSYDAIGKRTILGPVMMGACRGLNVLLGMSTAASLWQGASLHFVVAMAAYVAGITWFGRREAGVSSRRQLALSSGLMDLAVASIVGLLFWPGPVVRFHYFIVFPLFLVPWLSRITFRAVEKPEPALVQQGVRAGLMGIVVFDAAVVCAVRGAVWAAVVLSLLVPARLLARRVSPT